MQGFSIILVSSVCLQELMAMQELERGRCAKCQNLRKTPHTVDDTHSLAQTKQSHLGRMVHLRGSRHPLNVFARERRIRLFNPASAANARGKHALMRAPSLAKSHSKITLEQQSEARGSLPQMVFVQAGSRRAAVHGNVGSTEGSDTDLPNATGQDLFDVKRKPGLTDSERLTHEGESWLATMGQSRNSYSNGFRLHDTVKSVGGGQGLKNYEEKALSQSVQNALRWSAKREKLVTQLGRPLSDAEFAGELGLRGGAMEYRREMDRMRKDRDFFIISNVGLVMQLARKYESQGMEFDDLFQEGMLGLVKAVEKFDPARGCKFSTMAVPWVRQAMTLAISNKGSNIRVPHRMRYSILKMRKEAAIFYQVNGRLATEEELAKIMHISIDQLRAIRRAAYTSTISLDASASRSDDKRTLEATLGDKKMQPADFVDAAEKRGIMDRLIEKTLTREESLVFRMQHGLGAGGPRTRAAIARELNMDQGEVRRIAERAMAKLRRQREFNQYALGMSW